MRTASHQDDFRNSRYFLNPTGKSFTGIVPKGGINVFGAYVQPGGTCVFYYNGRDGQLLSSSELKKLNLERAVRHFKVEKIHFTDNDTFKQVLSKFEEYEKSRHASVDRRQAILKEITAKLVEAIKADCPDFSLDCRGGKRRRKVPEENVLPIH